VEQGLKMRIEEKEEGRKSAKTLLSLQVKA
jgi:hypothetical protein